MEAKVSGGVTQSFWVSLCALHPAMKVVEQLVTSAVHGPHVAKQQG